jgi:hypothetical protein
MLSVQFSDPELTVLLNEDHYNSKQHRDVMSQQCFSLYPVYIHCVRQQTFEYAVDYSLRSWMVANDARL